MKKKALFFRSDDPFTFTVKTDNAGTSASNQFTIPTTGFGYNYTISTSDGQLITGVTGNYTITFGFAGTYEIKITGFFPIIYFNNVGDKLKILNITNWGKYPSGTNQDRAFFGCSNLLINSLSIGKFENVTSFGATWHSCSNLTSFPLINTINGTNFQSTWFGCTSLSNFPLINTINGTNFQSTWFGCTSLSNFPLINTINGTFFSRSWQSCSNLTSFPLINTSNGTDFSRSWQSCSNLTTFTALDFRKATTFFQTWNGCTLLANFPANMFDNCLATNFTNAFNLTALTQASIDNILISINSNGTSNGTFNQSGGSAPSVVGQNAITSMRSRGWTITVTGGF